MQRKWAVVFVMVLVMSICVTTAAGSVAEMKQVFSDMADYTELCITRMKKATTPKQLLTALNRFADHMDRLGPKAVGIYNRNPQLFKDTIVDADMKKLQNRVISLFGQLAPVMKQKMNELKPLFTSADAQALIKVGNRFQSVTKYFEQMTGKGSSTSSTAAEATSYSNLTPKQQVVKVFRDICESGEKCIRDMKNARNGSQMVTALEVFADKMEILGPRCLSLYRKYPGVYKGSVTSFEVKQLLTRLTKVFADLTPVMKERLQALKATFTSSDAQRLTKVGNRFQNVAQYFVKISESAK